MKLKCVFAGHCMLFHVCCRSFQVSSWSQWVFQVVSCLLWVVSRHFLLVLGLFKHFLLVVAGFLGASTFIDIQIILDMCTLTCMLISSLWILKVFKIFVILIILYCLKSYWYIWIWSFTCLSVFRRETLYCSHFYIFIIKIWKGHTFTQL